MLYIKSISVPANTPPTSPAEDTITIEEEVVLFVSVRFPPGPSGLLKTALFYGDMQLFPSPKGSWAYGDNETVWDLLVWEAPESPVKLTIKAYNEDDTYDHSAIYRIVALNKEEAMFMRATWRLSESLLRFLRHVIGWRG